MIWETNGRFFQRDENGTKRISAERYRELSDDTLSIKLGAPFYSEAGTRQEILTKGREDHVGHLYSWKEGGRYEAHIFSWYNNILKADSYSEIMNLIEERLSPPQEEEIEIEIDFEEDDLCDTAERADQILDSLEEEPPRLISLFSGIGADRAAIEAETILSCEIDRQARETYQSIWRLPPTHDDVTKIEALPPSDLLVAGFPCQPYSSAGKRKGLSDPRALIRKVLSLIEGQPPETVILENVKGILAPQGAETLRMIKERLGAIYPHVDVISSCASDFGPMRRPRVFIIASQRGWEAPPLPAPLPPVSEHLSATLREEKECRIGEATWSALRRHKEKHSAAGNGFSYQWVEEDKVPTISARYWKDGSEALLRSSLSSTPRRLHPRELSSLFGWGELWTSPCSNTQAAKQLGNSISIPQLRWIWEGVR